MASSERPLLGKGSGQRRSCASDVLRAITKAQYYQLFVVLPVRIELTTSPLLGSCLSLIVATPKSLKICSRGRNSAFPPKRLHVSPP